MKKKTFIVFILCLLASMGTTAYADTVPHEGLKVMKYADVYGRDNYFSTVTSEGYWTGPSSRSVTTIQLTNYAYQVKASGGVSSDHHQTFVTWNTNNTTTAHYHIANDHLE